MTYLQTNTFQGLAFASSPRLPSPATLVLYSHSDTKSKLHHFAQKILLRRPVSFALAQLFFAPFVFFPFFFSPSFFFQLFISPLFFARQRKIAYFRLNPPTQQKLVVEAIPTASLHSRLSWPRPRSKNPLLHRNLNI